MLQLPFGSGRLVIQSAWRLMDNTEIVLGSDSAPERWQAAAALLVNLRVENVLVTNDFSDLALRFQGGVSVETFANAEQYEHWYVAAGPQHMVVAGPGKLWSLWEPPESP